MSRKPLSLAVSVLLAVSAAAGGRGQVDQPARYVVRAKTPGATVVVSYRLPATHPDPRFFALAVAISAEPGTAVELTRKSFTLRTPDRKLVHLMSREQFQERGAQLRPYLAKGEALSEPLGYAPAGRRDCRLSLFEPPRGRLMRDQVTVVGGSTCSGWLVFETPAAPGPGTYVLTIIANGLELKVPFEVPAG